MKLPGGLYQITVDFFDDERPAKPILTQPYVVTDKPTLVQLVAAQLQQFKQAADDAKTNMDIVGKIIGTV